MVQHAGVQVDYTRVYTTRPLGQPDNYLVFEQGDLKRTWLLNSGDGRRHLRQGLEFVARQLVRTGFEGGIIDTPGIQCAVNPGHDRHSGSQQRSPDLAALAGGSHVRIGRQYPAYLVAHRLNSMPPGFPRMPRTQSGR